MQTRSSKSRWRKILFILKRRGDYDPVQHQAKSMSTGLYNSAAYIVEMLLAHGHEAILEVAVDNNDIDRLVTQHRPSDVVIEALWVTPSKFKVLSDLHPGVTWTVRLHSDMPFIAGEGMAMDWIGDYSTYRNIVIAPNSQRLTDELKSYLRLCHRGDPDRVVYLPNVYPAECYVKRFDRKKYWIDVSCFGAVRPMKNHLTQLSAALSFADNIGKQLRFHINSGRVEGRGEPVMRNLVGMCAHIADSGHQLIAHQWMPRDEFVSLCGQMDIAMQVSFSETFNIVAADHVSQGVPLVSSSEIAWSSRWWQASPTSSRDISRAMHRAWAHPFLNVLLNKRSLAKYSRNSAATWLAHMGA